MILYHIILYHTMLMMESALWFVAVIWANYWQGGVWIRECSPTLKPLLFADSRPSSSVLSNLEKPNAKRHRIENQLHPLANPMRILSFSKALAKLSQALS